MRAPRAAGPGTAPWDQAARRPGSAVAVPADRATIAQPLGTASAARTAACRPAPLLVPPCHRYTAVGRVLRTPKLESLRGRKHAHGGKPPAVPGHCARAGRGLQGVEPRGEQESVEPVRQGERPWQERLHLCVVGLAALMVLLATVTPWPSLCRTGSPTANGCARWRITWATSGRCALPCEFSCCCDGLPVREMTRCRNDAPLSRAPWRAVLNRVRNRTPASR